MKRSPRRWRGEDTAPRKLVLASTQRPNPRHNLHARLPPRAGGDDDVSIHWVVFSFFFFSLIFFLLFTMIMIKTSKEMTKENFFSKILYTQQFLVITQNRTIYTLHWFYRPGGPDTIYKLYIYLLYDSHILAYHSISWSIDFSSLSQSDR